MSETWTIGELAEHAARALRGGAAPLSGRVRDVPGERLIRWYTTIGLLDPPLTRRGRIARYGRRHLLQLVAVKRLQAEGHSIADIQVALAGATDRTLEETAAIPAPSPTTRPAPPPHAAPPRPTSPSAPVTPPRPAAPPPRAPSPAGHPAPPTAPAPHAPKAPHAQTPHAEAPHAEAPHAPTPQRTPASPGTSRSPGTSPVPPHRPSPRPPATPPQGEPPRDLAHPEEATADTEPTALGDATETSGDRSPERARFWAERPTTPYSADTAPASESVPRPSPQSTRTASPAEAAPAVVPQPALRPPRKAAPASPAESRLAAAVRATETGTGTGTDADADGTPNLHRPPGGDATAAPGPDLVTGISLGSGVRIVWDGGRVPSQEDVQAVLAAAGPLLAVLEERELT
ncbi:MerR family transcriptional regulator [Actinomadura sp. ATCC 31491]|uniref:MerR family transcriptional regulator n=1 Tax=Actinomadura luzonensis TaxID=2805427 RepID=A0ABT0G809_9ACTN|nr:helix-turn-helix domain-containing protein [Actinomadura luzonensis]MCK2220734.1 MerR family transcriptional regulator [Actinomadura luzonensis]